jgi:plastocyanin
MKRLRLRAVAVAAVAVALGAVPALGAPQATPQATALAGTVGPGFTIKLTQGGKAVKTLRAGAYTITVNDKSGFHNFHLTGPGVNKKTSVAKSGKTTWKVTFRAGTYRYVCDPHASQMKGSFKVG